MKIPIEHRELANRAELGRMDSQHEWLASHAYASAEAIYNLTRGQASWDSTVSAMVDLHRRLVTKGEYNCRDYSKAFDSLVRRVLRTAYKCAQ